MWLGDKTWGLQLRKRILRNRIVELLSFREDRLKARPCVLRAKRAESRHGFNLLELSICFSAGWSARW